MAAPSRPSSEVASVGQDPTPAAWRQIVGWLAVGLTTTITCFWAFWGIIENFHEGWYHPDLASNLKMMVGQYFAPMLVFLFTGVVALYWPRCGACLLWGAAALAVWHFRGASPQVVYGFLASPLIMMGIAFWVGRPQPRRWAVRLLIGLPVVTVLVCGAEPVYRVSSRFDDGDLGMRTVEGDGVKLTWAPAGPGWPDHGVSWIEARDRCRHLSADGRTLNDKPTDLWRLPTIDELVRSAQRHGANAGGVWDAAAQQATFRIMPDKESPLWDRHSKIIYWWSATEIDDDRALRMCYNGHVMALPKKAAYGYLGFRAVRVETARPEERGEAFR